VPEQELKTEVGADLRSIFNAPNKAENIAWPRIPWPPGKIEAKYLLPVHGDLLGL
jgi:hypothetical protein